MPATTAGHPGDDTGITAAAVTTAPGGITPGGIPPGGIAVSSNVTTVPQRSGRPADRAAERSPDGVPVRWTPAVRAHYPGRSLVDEGAWRVGFSPSGEALPDSLADILARGSHAVRSAQKVEAQRLERAAAIADHVDRQLSDFLSICAGEGLAAPLTVRVHQTKPRESRRERRDRTMPSARRTPRAAAGSRRRGRADVWPILYWRSEGFPSAGRSLHLFVDPDGRTFEGLDDPGPLRVMGRQVRVWPVGVHDVVESMAEVDARRCAHQLVAGLAVLLWQSGVGL